MGDWDTRRVSGKRGGANVRRHIAAGVHYRARARRRPFIIYEIIYAARWGVGLPFHRDDD